MATVRRQLWSGDRFAEVVTPRRRFRRHDSYSYSYSTSSSSSSSSSL